MEKITDKILDGYKISSKEAEFLLSVDVYELIYCTNRIREHFKGRKINLCSIINAKSGSCSQDCRFCSQSAHHAASVDNYPLVSNEEIQKGLNKAVESKASCFGMVTSGHTLSEAELDDICSAISRNKGSDIKLSASLGALDKNALTKLKSSGLKKFHHNLETAESFFPNICTTHNYSERIEAVQSAKEAGLEVCSGGVMGLGETPAQRLELAFALKDLDVDSVPLNFLNPIPGTPLENQPRMSALEILRTIGIFRFILPDKDISVCGGREINLKDMQSWIFYAGANGMMIGGYLTTAGRSVQEDLRMIRELGFTYE